MCVPFFFFNDTATTEIYTLSLHDALPIFDQPGHSTQLLELVRLPLSQRFERVHSGVVVRYRRVRCANGKLLPLCHAVPGPLEDRKSTRLNSSHANISYAVFCLKKKNHSLTLQHGLCIDKRLSTPPELIRREVISDRCRRPPRTAYA